MRLMALTVGRGPEPSRKRQPREQGFRPRLMDIRTSAAYLGRSEASLRYLIAQGIVPVVRIGKRVHCAVEDLDALIEQSKVRYQ